MRGFMSSQLCNWGLLYLSKFFYHWSCDHCVVTKGRKMATQWNGAISEKKGTFNMRCSQIYLELKLTFNLLRNDVEILHRLVRSERAWLKVCPTHPLNLHITVECRFSCGEKLPLVRSPEITSLLQTSNKYNLFYAAVSFTCFSAVFVVRGPLVIHSIGNSFVAVCRNAFHQTLQICDHQIGQ